MRTFLCCSALMAVFCLGLSCASAPPNPDMVADMDPVDVGIVQAGFGRFFSSEIDQKNVSVTYEPRIGQVVLQFAFQTVTYKQYWTPAARTQFIAALEQYKAEYDARTISPKGLSRARRAYGSVKSTIEWGYLSMSFVLGSRGNPSLSLGYTFHKNSPYFVITQNSARNILREGSSDGTNESPRITMYFTRAMAENLAELFDEAYLRSLLGDFTPPNQTVTPDDWAEKPIGD